ncbi:zinc-dependent metalloprotease [Bifidobacterium sp. ESL0775]|uniref:zinc-dependent metalloprotease n=1 Tax=Bifidobacterium sp. ESL0775 TaxID=2983230 RepID=UPI0023F8B22C|nr:zinc-dependent metalloprotease [Bifidobacterium sp. ESL0775]WEV69753.1 zinc-dependent metalloprotease [Bifidobacterium sp. ESL0775]
MDENAIHQWLIDCFGQIQGDMAFQQLSALPDAVKDQLMGQDPSKLPKPSEVKALMNAFASSGLNTMGDMQQSADQGPVNVKLATSLALAIANDEGSEQTVTASEGEAVRRAMSEANLWLDTACDIDPAPGEPQVFTRADWVNATVDSWAKFASPVEESMGNALSSVISERFGDAFDGGEIAGIFAGPVPVPIPDNMKDPANLIKILGNTAFSTQLGHAAGQLSHEVRGSFDQGIALQKNPAGALIAQNSIEYAKTLEIDQSEVLAFLALEEEAHARLFAHVPWLMPRFEALIGKYARGINIDLDAMEEQLREATSMDPDSISGAVDLTKVGIADTPEQKEALESLETLLALVEGWVDAVTWKAGMAHIPHIEQLREMVRRERAVGGPAERTFESLLGMELRPKCMREAADIWEKIGAEQGDKARDEMWSHPDLLPKLPDADGDKAKVTSAETNVSDSNTNPDANITAPTTDGSDTTGSKPSIDWDAELEKLLDAQGDEGDADDANHTGTANNDAADNSGDNGNSSPKPDNQKKPDGDHPSDETGDGKPNDGDAPQA